MSEHLIHSREYSTPSPILTVEEALNSRFRTSARHRFFPGSSCAAALPFFISSQGHLPADPATEVEVRFAVLDLHDGCHNRVEDVHENTYQGSEQDDPQHA